MTRSVHPERMISQVKFVQSLMNLADAILEIGPAHDVIAPAEKDIPDPIYFRGGDFLDPIHIFPEQASIGPFDQIHCLRVASGVEVDQQPAVIAVVFGDSLKISGSSVQTGCIGGIRVQTDAQQIFAAQDANHKPLFRIVFGQTEQFTNVSLL